MFVPRQVGNGINARNGKQKKPSILISVPPREHVTRAEGVDCLRDVSFVLFPPVSWDSRSVALGFSKPLCGMKARVHHPGMCSISSTPLHSGPLWLFSLALYPGDTEIRNRCVQLSGVGSYLPTPMEKRWEGILTSRNVLLLAESGFIWQHRLAHLSVLLAVCISVQVC